MLEAVILQFVVHSVRIEVYGILLQYMYRVIEWNSFYSKLKQNTVN